METLYLCVACLPRQCLGAKVLREPCDCAPLPTSSGQIGRTLRLGRVLWCLAAAGNAAGLK